MAEIEKELAHYRRIFSLKDSDLAISGYIAYVGFVKQQVEYMEGFKLKENIEGKKTETVVYDRAMSMGESLPDMISKMNRLKAELKIDFDINSDKPKVGATNPQTIANLPKTNS
jgi:hypothetical protein